jgi:membrane protein DedA with SNARE-associated domain
VPSFGCYTCKKIRQHPADHSAAGPLADAGGLPPLRFFAANLAGAICYVPYPVLAGYGLGDWIERLRRAAGLEKDAALFAATLTVASLEFIVMMWARDRQAARPAGRGDERDI